LTSKIQNEFNQKIVLTRLKLLHPEKGSPHNSLSMQTKILAVSGSLRENSSTQHILNNLKSWASPDVEIIVYTSLAELPHFNDAANPPAAVHMWRRQLAEANAVLLCTPEYAFGVPGSLKNALDWTVSSGDFVDKPVAVITAATQGDKAHASLLLTLSALSAKLSEKTNLLIPFIRARIQEDGNIKDAETIKALQGVLYALIKSAATL
jgi:chromate reductase, NAD(P)H dehydrogenase (quinone)